jgi:hypothetical protein
MVLIQLLLPTVVRTTDGSHSTVASLADTRRELEQQFDGLTAYTRSTAQGVWTAPDGRTETDDVLLIEVVTEHFDSPWWATYASRLASRFHQESIHVRAITIEMPGPTAL